MDFKKWVKSIQTAGYNGARTVDFYGEFEKKKGNLDLPCRAFEF